MPNQKRTQAKTKRKPFRSKGRGDTFAKRKGKERELTAELDKQVVINAKLADIERRKTEARDRETYHELRLREVNPDGKEA